MDQPSFRRTIPHHASQRLCEACAADMAAWQLGPDCILWRCNSCGHVIRSLTECRAGARDHPWGGRGEFDRVRAALTLRSLRRILPDRHPLDVLEIGFGRGILLSALLRDGHRVTGIDPGTLEAEVSEELLQRGTIHVQPAEEVDLTEGAFDLVYAVHVVEHLQDPAGVFASVHRALRPDGLFYLMTPNSESAGLRVFRKAWWNLEDPTHVRFFTPRSVGLMLRRAGFRRGRIRLPMWDSQTLEVSSLMRAFRRDSGEHGVLGSKLALPLTAALLPVAMGARLVWPELSPSMEVVARPEPGA
jgi:SAM-dependent methyltransferase